MAQFNRFGDDDKHTPGKNDGLPSNPAAIVAYERKRAESRRLQREALELRMAGYSYSEIGRHQGVAASTASTRVQKAIRRDVPQELIESTRAIELERIDAMTLMCQQIMQKAYDSGDTETYFKAQDRANVLGERRARIVPINQPTKLVIDQQVTTQNDQDRELSELIGKEADKVKAKIDALNRLNQDVYGDG